LLGAHAAIVARQHDFEQLLVLETGKPLVDCRVEVARTLLTLQTAAEEVARLHGETVPLDLLPSGEGLLGFWVRKPIGVVVGIAGYNYPLLLAAHKVAPALAAGCPVIAKPAPQTPLATLWLGAPRPRGARCCGWQCRGGAARHGRSRGRRRADHGPADRGGVLHRLGGRRAPDRPRCGADQGAARARLQHGARRGR